MKRVGAVLVFKTGTTKAQAEEVLDTIRKHLDEKYYCAGRTPVYEYDDNCGSGPVWYIP